MPALPTLPLTHPEQAFQYLTNEVRKRVRAVNRARSALERTMKTCTSRAGHVNRTTGSQTAIGAYELAEERLLTFIAKINCTETVNIGSTFEYPPTVCGKVPRGQQTYELRGVEVELVRSTQRFGLDQRINAVIVRGLIRRMGGGASHDYSSKSSHQ